LTSSVFGRKIDLQTEKARTLMNSILKWAGCVAVVTGALCTSLRIDPANIYLLNVGALLYTIWAIRIRELNLIIVNIVLLIIYIMGLFFG
jgi:hypothetical protein